MMTYLEPRKKINKSKKLIIVTIIFVLIILLVQTIWPNLLSGIFNAIFRPFWRIEYTINSGSAKSVDSLLFENEMLRNKLGEAEIRLQSIKLLESENEQLRKSFGRATTSPKLLSAVLKRPPLFAYDELIIDVGKDYGVSTGTLVYSTSHVLVGMVNNVFDRTSQVLLLSSPGQKYEVIIGPNHEPATAVGKGGGQFEATVPNGAKINEGDVVIDPAMSNRILGTVTAKIFDPAQPFGKILFSLSENIYNMRWVLLDIPNKK